MGLADENFCVYKSTSVSMRVCVCLCECVGVCGCGCWRACMIECVSSCALVYVCACICVAWRDRRQVREIEGKLERYPSWNISGICHQIKIWQDCSSKGPTEMNSNFNVKNWYY